MFAVASGKAKSDMPKKVAEEMIEATEKSEYKKMPERKKKRLVVKKKKKGGK